MLNRKLLEILVRFSPDQHKKFRLFLVSPYFNQTVRSETLIRLYDYIMVFGADENHPQLRKPAVFNFFFPGQIFPEHQKGPLDSLTTELYNLTKRFLGQQKREESVETEGIAMLEFYRKFGMEDRFRQTADVLKKEIENEPYRDAEHYRKRYLLDGEITTFVTGSNTFQDDANLLSFNHNLDMAYAINKMEVLCALAFQKKVASFEDTSIAELSEVVQRLSKSGDKLISPINDIFTLILDLIEDQRNASKINQLATLLEQYKSITRPHLFNNQLLAYYRFFVQQQALESTNKEDRQKTYLLYKSHYEQGYFFIEGAILISSLHILIQMAIRNDDLAWALNLLNTHHPGNIIGTRFSEEAYNLLWADYYFAGKSYEAAQEKIDMRLFENPVYSILADVLIIKIYFEQKNDILEYRMKALDQKVRRSKMSANLKERYLNFLRKLDKLNKSLAIPNKPKLNKILEEVKTLRNIYERDWLIGKIVEHIAVINAR